MIGADAASSQTSRTVSFCAHTIETEDCMLEDATKDERFARGARCEPQRLGHLILSAPSSGRPGWTKMWSATRPICG